VPQPRVPDPYVLRQAQRDGPAHPPPRTLLKLQVKADARALPIRANSVDLIVTNPPYPRSVGWEDYAGEVDRAKAECRRVLRPSGRAFMLLPVNPTVERWFVFNKRAGNWRHTGHAIQTGASWGIVPPGQVVPIINCHSRAGDVVLDPFAGANNIPALASAMGRVGIGSDLEV
jgi:tRNA G10  N-methylase Trm11